MSKIEKLTEEQEILLQDTLDKWLRIGRSCEPLNMQKVESIIEEFYKRIGKDKPIILKFDSPYSCMLAMVYLKNKDQLRDQLRDQLMSQLWDQLSDQLRDQLMSQLWDQLSDQLRDRLSDPLRDQLRGQLMDQLWDQLWDQLSDRLSDQLRDQLRDRLSDQLWDQLRDRLSDQLIPQLNWNYLVGNLWSYPEVFYDYCNHIGVQYTKDQRSLLDLWIDQAEYLHFWWPIEGVCVISERPSQINMDNAGRLHNINGPAIQYIDGWSVYAINGVRIPEKYFTKAVTVDIIDQERNAEISRKLIERYGLQKYIEDSNAEKIAEDEWGILYRKEVLNDEPIVMVSVLNSTPEEYEYEGLEERLEKREFRRSELGTPGKYKRYMLRVPPDTKTPLQGLAWMANMTEEEYVRLDCES